MSDVKLRQANPCSQAYCRVERLADPGFVITKADFVKPPADKKISNLALQISPDGHKVVLSGDLTRGGGLLHRNAPTPNWVVQLALGQERWERPVTRPEEPLALPLKVPGTTFLAIRKLPDGWESKTYKLSLELREGSQTIWQNPELPQNAPLQIRNRPCRVTATVVGDQVRVDVVERRPGFSLLEKR